jgi:hypothetical protein
MDFIEGFPRVGSKSVVLTVVDHFSKYGHFIALGHPYTATLVAKAFFDQIVRLTGLPASIISDRDRSSPAESGRTCSGCRARNYT